MILGVAAVAETPAPSNLPCYPAARPAAKGDGRESPYQAKMRRKEPLSRRDRPCYGSAGNDCADTSVRRTLNESFAEPALRSFARRARGGCIGVGMRRGKVLRGRFDFTLLHRFRFRAWRSLRRRRRRRVRRRDRRHLPNMPLALAVSSAMVAVVFTARRRGDVVVEIIVAGNVARQLRALLLLLKRFNHLLLNHVAARLIDRVRDIGIELRTAVVFANRFAAQAARRIDCSSRP